MSAFGLPKSDARLDSGDPGTLHLPGSTTGLIRQNFQAAVLEFHPVDPAGQTVKLTLLGDALRDCLVPDHQDHSPFGAAPNLAGDKTYEPYALPPPAAT